MNSLLWKLHWPFQRRLAAPGKRRALLRLIATAIEERLDLTEVVTVWSWESRGRWRVLLSRLARTLAEGTPLPDALERHPNLLSDEETLLIRFAHESGSLAPSLRRRLEAEPHRDVSPWRDSAWYLAIFALIGLPVGIFCVHKINPELNTFFNYFSLERPTWLVVADVLGGLMLNVWLLALLFFLVSRGLRVFDTPGVWFRRRVLGRVSSAAREHRIAGVFQRLGDTAAAGRPLTGALATLARRHYDPSIRHRLLEARNEIGLGVEPWAALAGAGLLNTQERDALEAADPLDARAWTLGALADARGRRAEVRSRRAGSVATFLTLALFSSFVLLLALGVFSFLEKIITSIA